MLRRARGAPPGLARLLLFAAAATTFPSSGLSAQLRREAPVQPVSEVLRGDWLIGVGFSNAVGGTYPLSGYTGDLLSLGEITIGYGLGDRALVQLSGAAVQRLSIDAETEPAIPLDPASGGVTTDAGDFRISTAFTPIGSVVGFSAGALVEVKLPNSDEKKGIGTNTTDVTLGLIGSWGADAWRGTGTVGIAILEAPVENFEQNDLVAYAFDVLLRASPRIRLALGLAGLANVRRTAPLGTESRGAATMGAEWLAGAWRLDASLARGIVGNTPDWRLAAGVAWSRSSGRVSNRRRSGEGP